MTRLQILRIAIIVLLSLLIMALFNLQLLQGWRFKDLSDSNCIRLLPQGGSRGRILDRDGKLIAGNKLSYDVMIMPQEATELDDTFAGIAKILGTTSESLKDKFNAHYQVSFSPVTVAENIDIKKAVALEEHKSDLVGMVIQPKPVRLYPNGRLGCHLLGYLNEIDRWRLTKLEDYGYQTRDIVGFGGIEERYDYYLRPEAGGISVQVDHRGRLMRVLGFKAPKNGLDIRLTINLRIQRIAEDALAGKKGCVVMIQPFTGEIIAMASNPAFSPDMFLNKKESSINEVFHDRNAPLINRVISASYPAGSVFKAIVATAALETGKINGHTTVVCTGKAYVGRQEFACWSTHGVQNLAQAIAHSCNVFFYHCGLAVGPQGLHDYALKFGLSHPSGVDLPYEIAGFIPNPLWKQMVRFQHWYNGDTANFAIGQGDVAVTPMQIVRMMAVFANKGLLVTPYIVQSVAGADVSLNQRKATKLSIRQGVIDQVREGLRGVVTDESGTGNILAGLSVAVAGKTGTAQAPPGQPHAWFAGFFPYERPSVAICVLLEHGGPGHAACAVAKEIIAQMITEGLVE